MGNVGFASEKFKNFSSFLWQELAGKNFLAKNIIAHRSTKWFSVDFFENFSTSQLFRKMGLKKNTACRLRNPKIETFIVKNSIKKIRRPKKWNIIDRDPVVVFMQKSYESDH